ncbi:LOW QUALITY PROTEIN: hypothetical protein YC2023_115192 [Brassica napus]
MVKVYVSTHTCHPTRKCKLIKSHANAEIMLEQIRKEPEMSVPVIKEEFRNMFNIIIFLEQAKIARRIVLDKLHAECNEHFARLRDYEMKLLRLPCPFRVITGLELHWMRDGPAGTKDAENSAMCRKRDKIGAAPYDGCLRTLVERIKPFVVRLGVKVLMTSFPVGPLWSSFYVAVIRRVAADGILYGCRGKTTSFRLCVNLRDFLKTFEYWQRDKFWDLVSGCLILCLEMLETSALGLGQDLGFLSDRAVTGRLSFFLLRFLPDSYRFKVRDRFSAYTTCLIRIEHLSRDRKCWTKILDFFYSAIILVSDVRESSS